MEYSLSIKVSSEMLEDLEELLKLALYETRKIKENLSYRGVVRLASISGSIGDYSIRFSRGPKEACDLASGIEEQGFEWDALRSAFGVEYFKKSSGEMYKLTDNPWKLEPVDSSSISDF
ncbi:hypothetical protein [Pseudomonas aeruginosa]|uniref:hypothetical protein n=1 Tax=Pseudomonas aeruginosa TaxID=287 RepID=UPI0021E7555A|nr:hypothetical protein [Pseudomonas aeruginosa]MCV3784855.1 hypothetical protein [Pseudomonas aeruginosa]MCV3827877.1 hypothetical protein [Pseudomonas aeruginosa]